MQAGSLWSSERARQTPGKRSTMDGERRGLQECAGVVEKENGHEADERRGHRRV